MNKTKEILSKVIYETKDNKWIHYIILTIIGISLSVALSKIQIRDTHDGALHFLRILGTKDSLEIGQFPPLINQNFCKGAGYSMNLFYQPLVTYLPLLITMFISNYMVALKVFAALCIIASGITMYQFTYQVTKNRVISLFAGFFYMIIPYKLENIYKRFAIGEFTAMVFIPFVFLGLYNLFEQDGKKHYYIAIGATGMMLSHTITTLYTAIFCIIYIIFNIYKLKNFEVIKKCIINASFILLMSSLFWAPLLEATSSANYAIMDDVLMNTRGCFVNTNTISFSELFIDNANKEELTFFLGIPTIVAIVLTIFVFKKVNKKYKDIYVEFILFSIISLYMASKLFPWTIMPNILCKLQYPWRMLSFFIFFISFICGVNLYLAIKNIIKNDYIRTFVILLFIIFSIIDSNLIISRFYTKDITFDERYQDYIINNKKISCKEINRDYMPVKAVYLQNTYVKDREDKTYILEGKAEIVEETKENLTDIIKVKNISKNTIFELPYYYYVGYRVTILADDGSTKRIEPIESENGYLACAVTENMEDVTIKVEYVGTTITYISYAVSAISLIIFIGYIVYENKKRI